MISRYRVVQALVNSQYHYSVFIDELKEHVEYIDETTEIFSLSRRYHK